jgi:peptide/nickel transport system substrate-binding protein
MRTTLDELEDRYSYNKQAAQDAIAQEMEARGAVMGDDGCWYYNGEPVELLFVIRNDDQDQSRFHLGNHIADELESIGFRVQRLYKDFQGARTLCMESDPREGGWHLCTNGWNASTYSSFMGHDVANYYTPLRRSEPLFRAYEPEDELLDLATRLLSNDFNSVAERQEVFARALELSLEDSVRIWLAVRR